MSSVAITGVSTFTPFGVGVEALMAGLDAGRVGVRGERGVVQPAARLGDLVGCPADRGILAIERDHEPGGARQPRVVGEVRRPVDARPGG